MIDIFWIIVMFLLMCCQLLGRKLLPKFTISQNIPDLGHKYIINIDSKLSYLSDIICMILLMTVMCTLDKSKKVMYVKCFIVVFILRLISMNLTILPRSKEFKCDDSSAIVTLNVQCGNDYIFSGHTAITVLCLLMLYTMYPNYVYFYVIIYALQVFLLLGMRHHYSIDIFIGTLLSYFVFDKFQK